MKERPILFSAPMVRALLDGSKTQTRRIFKLPRGCSWYEALGGEAKGEAQDDNGPAWWHVEEQSCPYGQPGDRLWVRENFMDMQGTGVEHRPDPNGPLHRYAYRADTPPGSHGDEARKEYGLKWKPSIHMPRTACRITLHITGVRVERLQEISRGDAMAEGCPFPNMAKGNDPRHWYTALWEQINGPGSWDANPWVWVVEFKKATP